MITALRRFLDERGYVEVETPILHKPEEAGGAAARPFATHHNALDLDLKMRIATELHLKRLIVGGLERVYEVGRIFRNEGIDRRHNPEFTSVEFYQAYATHEDLMALTEQMVQALALAATGRTRLPYQGVEIDYAAPWPRVSMVGEVARLLAPQTAGGPLSKLGSNARTARSRQSAPLSMTASSSRITSTERTPQGSRRAKPAIGQPTRSRRAASAIRC